MGDESGGGTLQPSSSDSTFEVACQCLNIRAVVHRLDGSGHDGDNGGEDAGEVRVELDEEASRDGGAIRVSHPRLVVEEERPSASSTSTSTGSRSSSRDKGKERASSDDVESHQDDMPLTSLRCLNCSCVLLTYPAESASSSPIAPKSSTGQYTIDLSSSSKLVVGSQRIAELSDKEKNPDWSDLYRVIIPASSSLHTSTGDSDEAAATSSFTPRRSASSDTIDSKKSDGMDEGHADGLNSSSPVALRRPSSLKRTNSGTGTGGMTRVAGRSSSASQSPFHSVARARIKRDRQEMESKITRIREAFEAESRRYIEQADTLASKLKAAGKSSKRNASPSASKGGTTDRDGSSRSGENSHIIIRGGFDTPKAEAASPEQQSSYSSGLGRTPITSPHLATAGNFPALFSSMSGATLASSSPAAGESVPTREPKKDGIVQPTGPQSPTFRRSRSPSPSRDTSVGRNGSKDREARDTAGAAGSSTMERQTSDEHYNTAATTSKRPALNLMRDVSNLEQEKQKKGDNASEQELTRGRSTAAPGTSLPTHSVLRKTGYNPNMSASHAPRQRGAWLRLNGISPSPPANRLMLDRDLPESEKEKAGEESGAEKQEGNGSEEPLRRASLAKHRHVSFKEPEPGSSVEASPAPAEQSLEPEEEDEVPFDMDEDIAHLADEAEDDEEDGAFIETESRGQAANDETALAAEATAKESEAVAGSVNKLEGGGSLSRSVDRKGQAAASLQALLNDPSSFIGSLKSRGFGAATPTSAKTGRSPADFAISPDSDTAKDRVSLSDQAQRLRDLLALDAPSHRSTKGKRDKALASYLRDSTEAPDTEDIPDDELDSVAPVSALATSLPVAIGVPRLHKKAEHDLERKTSLPQRESMLVPPLRGSGRHRSSKPGQYSPIDRLPSLGEESEEAAGSRAVSPSGVPGLVNTETGDAMAAGNDEADEVMDKLADLETKRDFIPPHAWRFRDPVRAVDMLGTSVHDYE